MKKELLLSLIVFFAFHLFSGCRTAPTTTINYSSISPVNADATINMIVEIPAGTTAKYEMNKTNYQIQMDSIDGRPRYINYLGYPGNYGMIPNTILSKSDGGDGDPLDVLLLGPAVDRGSVQKVKIIGVLRLLDGGEQDDKLIAVAPTSNWSKIDDIDDLDTHYPGVKTIVATFFEQYKGNGEMKLIGWADKAQALNILHVASSSN